MNYGQAIQAVLEEVKRPDKLSIIRRELNAALAFYVTDINGMRDSQEQLVPIDPLEYTQEFDLSILTRFRKFRYLKLAGTKTFLTEISIPEVVSGCANMRNRWYLMGNAVKISLSSLTANLDVCYWQHAPELSAGTDTHWLLESYWPAVTDRAAYKVFASIGDKDEAARFKNSADEHWRNKRNDLGAEGTQ